MCASTSTDGLMSLDTDLFATYRRTKCGLEAVAVSSEVVQHEVGVDGAVDAEDAVASTVTAGSANICHISATSLMTVIRHLIIFTATLHKTTCTVRTVYAKFEVYRASTVTVLYKGP
jgi:hypothetical protein